MKKVLSIFFLLIILIVAIFIIYHGPVYTYRVLVWQDSDYDDYLLFNTKPVVKGKQTFNFESASPSQEDQFRKDFSIANSISNIDSLMIANNTYAFIVIRNDTLIYENYFFNNNRESMQTSFSTAKSILSLLIGIAIQENKIKSINDPITDYIPELKDRDSKFMEITIEDLLHMRSGIAFKKGVSFPFVNSDEPMTYSHPDLRYVAINKTRIVDDPDIKFLYNDYNALLLGLILERSTGEEVNKYLESRIWKKIGMEYDGSWNSDNKGFEQMQSGVNARAIDFAKIGRLVLQNGKWGNETVVDSNWIRLSTTTTKDTMAFRSGQQWAYSKLWWNSVNERLKDDVFACGHMGQFIFISPSSNTIIIRNGLESHHMDDDDWVDLFGNYARMYPESKLDGKEGER